MRKGDGRKEREESHGRGERKDSDRERDRDKEVENISAGFSEKPADGYMEEDGEIREFQTEDEVQIKANSDALGNGLLDAKKSEVCDPFFFFSVFEKENMPDFVR